MGMQTDVFASAPLTTSGQFEDASETNALTRVRVKTIYGTCDTTVGTVVLYDSTDTSGSVIITVNVPDNTAQGTYWLPLPGEGILAQNGVYADITGVASVMIIYG